LPQTMFRREWKIFVTWRSVGGGNAEV
jgi:hypothetical protein